VRWQNYNTAEGAVHTVTLTPDQIREIAEVAAERVAEKAADKAVRATLSALGVNLNKMHEEQQVWAFARNMQQGSRLGARAIITALATSFAGWIWLVFYKH